MTRKRPKVCESANESAAKVPYPKSLTASESAESVPLKGTFGLSRVRGLFTLSSSPKTLVERETPDGKKKDHARCGPIDGQAHD